MSSYPSAVRIVEVGPRDGLQSINIQIPTQTKIDFINALSEANLPEIEVTSFVSPKWVPQLADASEVSAAIIRKNKIRYTALVPNLVGLQHALDAGYDSVAVLTTVSETFSFKNTNCTIKESLHRIEQIADRVQKEKQHFRAYISTVWDCPYEGSMSAEKAVPIISQLLDLGVEEISLGDTIGKATPASVQATLDVLTVKFGTENFALHFHDTFGNALENIKVGLKYGISVYDSSAGGIGGCPYAPGAKGNVSTNSVVELCNQKEIHTGINLVKLREASELIQPYIYKS